MSDCRLHMTFPCLHLKSNQFWPEFLLFNIYSINLQGDLHEYLKKKGPLKPATALRFAMDIARFVIL